MHTLYNIGISLYSRAIAIASLFSKKAKLRHNGAKKTFSLLEKFDNSDTIWIHSASLGEFEQGRPLIEKLRERYPDSKILLSFFSPSGYEIRKNYNGVDMVVYLPMDTKYNAKKFISIIKPKMAIFIKYEFWVNYLFELKEQNIPTYIISSIFRPDQIFFKRNGNFFVEALKCFTHIFVQNQQSKDLLKSISINEVTIAGDTRFDRVANITESAKEIPFVDTFISGNKIIVAGSTWPGDEELLCKYINENKGRCKIIIAPHEVSKTRTEEICKRLNCRYSVWTELRDNNEDLISSDCLIIDTIGILSSIYKYGKIAYIGGGFGVGIHNTLEAAAWGMPVVWGPNYHKFQEAKDLIEERAGFSISDYNLLKTTLDNLLKSSHTESIAAKEYVSKMCGATNIILDKIEKI